MLTLNWDTNGGNRAKAHFRSHPSERLLLAENPQTKYERVTLWPKGKPSPEKINSNTLVLTQDSDSDDEVTVNYTTSNNLDSPIFKKQIKDEKLNDVKKILEKSGIRDFPTMESAESYTSPSRENMRALLDAVRLSQEHDLKTYFIGSYIKTSDRKIYLVGQNIGSGSRSNVYMAVDENNKHFALKFSMRSGVEHDTVQSAENEANFYRELGILSSPTIHYHDSKLFAEIFITPMHYVNEKTLSKYLEDHPNRTLDKCYELAIKLCFLIEKLHRKGIAHGDIKPENIIIDENDELHLIDFECATKAINFVQTYESTKIYMLPNTIPLTRRQADILALMRSIFMDERFLTADETHPIYTAETRYVAIFKSNDLEVISHITNKIEPLLSTKFLEEDNQTLFSKEKILEKLACFRSPIDLALSMALQSPKLIQTLTRAALEFEKLDLAPTSFEFQYVTTEHAQPCLKQDDIQTLKQSLRIMGHRYSRFTKQHLIDNNVFFKLAIAHASIEPKDLHHIFRDKMPSGICTRNALYQAYKEKNLPNPDEVMTRLKEAGIFT